jgi:hypothetical protein
MAARLKIAMPAEIIAFSIEETKTKKAATIRTLSSVFWLSLFIDKIIPQLKEKDKIKTENYLRDASLF